MAISTPGKMEIYLKDCNKSVEFHKTLENFDTVTELEFGGSTTFKDIKILVRIFFVTLKNLKH